MVPIAVIGFAVAETAALPFCRQKLFSPFLPSELYMGESLDDA